MRKRKHRKKSIKRSDVKLYLSIVVICFLMAIVVNILFKCSADVTSDVRMILDAESDVETIMKLKKEYEENTGTKVKGMKDIDTDKLEKQELEKLKSKLDPAQIERYKDRLKRYNESNQ